MGPRAPCRCRLSFTTHPGVSDIAGWLLNCFRLLRLHGDYVTMKAIMFDSFGGPEVLKVVEDYELPAKSSGEVRVYSMR